MVVCPLTSRRERRETGTKPACAAAVSVQRTNAKTRVLITFPSAGVPHVIPDRRDRQEKSEAGRTWGCPCYGWNNWGNNYCSRRWGREPMAISGGSREVEEASPHGGS